MVTQWMLSPKLHPFCSDYWVHSLGYHLQPVTFRRVTIWGICLKRRGPRRFSGPVATTDVALIKERYHYVSRN